jgi:hypothetical protein
MTRDSKRRLNRSALTEAVGTEGTSLVANGHSRLRMASGTKIRSAWRSRLRFGAATARASSAHGPRR